MIDEYIVFGTLDILYHFLRAVYQHIIAKNYTVSELISLKKLGYRQDEMTEGSGR